MLSGRTEMPPAFSPVKPQATDWPSMAAIANSVIAPRNNLPPAMVLPDRMVHQTGRVIPGQGAGMMGMIHEPWFVEASPFHPKIYGAYPQYAAKLPLAPLTDAERQIPFQAPNLSLPEGLGGKRLQDRLALLNEIGQQRALLDQAAVTEQFDRFREDAVNLLANPKTQSAFDVHAADGKLQDRYGRNSFGWSLLMARQLVEAGVSLVQVNLGNNESWDTHGDATEMLRDHLFPPTDRAVSALLDDLQQRGLLDSTLVIMASEFGRTPYTSGGPSYKTVGRNHWGGVQTAFLAGGGIQGGRVVGASDKIAAYPTLHPQKPENFAATIYESLGIPRTTAWHDAASRPHFVYHGEPIPGLV